jgi:hypothetical protein
MTPKEKRTVRFAAMGIGVYLALFAGYQAWKVCEKKRADYLQLVTEAQDLKDEVRRYDDKIAVVRKLMESFHMDPAALKKSSVVAEASAAIQQAAQGGGFQIGAIRETQAHASGKELGSIDFEGAGPVKGAMGLLHRLQSIGYPLVIDSVQFSADPMRPDQIKVKLTVVVLDFEQWKAAEAPHA